MLVVVAVTVVDEPLTDVVEPTTVVDEPVTVVVDEPTTDVDEPGTVVVDEPPTVVDDPLTVVVEPTTVVDEPVTVVVDDGTVDDAIDVGSLPRVALRARPDEPAGPHAASNAAVERRATGRRSFTRARFRTTSD